jgi:hypothetical protein
VVVLVARGRVAHFAEVSAFPVENFNSTLRVDLFFAPKQGLMFAKIIIEDKRLEVSQLGVLS